MLLLVEWWKADSTKSVQCDIFCVIKVLVLKYNQLYAWNSMHLQFTLEVN